MALLDSFGGIPPKFEHNYIGISKDMEKGCHNCQIAKQMKTSYDLGFITIGVAMAT